MNVRFKYEPDCLKYDAPVLGGRCKQCDAPGVVRSAHYTPDFKLENGTYIETKGKFTSKNRTLLRNFKLSGPPVLLRILFQANNWLTKKHTQRYGDWATKNGFEWAVGTLVPTAWTK